MAYWNPFGWSEETRRSIQSVVRPVMQVASMAASMGAFSGGGAKASTTPDAATASGADFDQPSTAMPTDPNDMGTLEEWTTDQAINAPSTPIETPYAPQPASTMNVPSAGTTTGSGLIDPNLQQGGLDNQYFKGSEMIIPENTTQFQDVAQAEGLVVEPVQQQAEPQYNKGDILDTSKDSLGNAKSFTSDKEGNFIVTKTTQPKTEQTTTQPKTEQTTTQQPGQVKPPTTETPDKPPATKTPNNQQPEVKPKDGKGRGGKEWDGWDGKAFNWENIEKFLKSKEGRHWLLIDEKGFAGIGRKLTAAADAGVSGYSRLTAEERKKIRDRLEKEREKRRERREEDE